MLDYAGSAASATTHLGALGAAESSRILVVDDHADIRDPLATYLRRNGMHVATAGSASEMQAHLANQAFDLLVLDVMLPDGNGMDLCRDLSRTAATPVILLTARASLPDRLAGLQTGADDYVVKPFEPSELVARIHAVLRRQARNDVSARRSKRLVFDRWVIDLARRELSDANGTQVPIGDAEFQLLTVLLAHANQVLSRDRLLDLTQRNDELVFDRSIDTRISRLRRKLEIDPRRPALIKTAWGNGYIFVADVRTLAA